MDQLSNFLSNSFYWFVFAIVGITFGIKNGLSMYVQTKVDKARSEGELDVIQMLRDQVAELGRSNHELRLEISQLREINRNLVIENENLRLEVRALKRHVEEFIENFGASNG